MPDPDIDRTIGGYVAATTGITLLSTEQGRTIPEAALADIEFTRGLPLPWSRPAGNFYGLLATTGLEERA